MRGRANASMTSFTFYTSCTNKHSTAALVDVEVGYAGLGLCFRLPRAHFEYTFLSPHPGE